jgi:protoheme IX farnesyltransferase
LLLSAAGLSLTGLAAGPAGCALAGLAAAWYEGVYTPLKRATAFAVVPGALVGAVPPVLGWLAAGRPWQDPRLLALCFFFYLWQVPHFWLLVPRYGADLERAGLPNLGKVLGEVRLARLTAVWMSVAAASALLLPVFGAVGSTATLILLAAAAWLTTQAVRLMRAASGRGERQPFGDDAPWRVAFSRLNAFVLGVMALLACDPFLARLSSLRP